MEKTRVTYILSENGTRIRVLIRYPHERTTTYVDHRKFTSYFGIRRRFRVIFDEWTDPLLTTRRWNLHYYNLFFKVED